MPDSRNDQQNGRDQGVTKLTVAGYKSITTTQELEISNLTVLCGANSSGKSSMIQPLLLLKQTLEASFDPGPLLLNGPNVAFTAADQFFSRKDGTPENVLEVGVTVNREQSVLLRFRRGRKGIDLTEMRFTHDGHAFHTITRRTPHDKILQMLQSSVRNMYNQISQRFEGRSLKWKIDRDRCFLVPVMADPKSHVVMNVPSTPAQFMSNFIQDCIHLPGLRGNPERAYPVTAVGSRFPGTFQQYAASVIANWQGEKRGAELESLSTDLERLGLSWRVRAIPLDDTRVEVRVGRLLHRGPSSGSDVVNIADVGLGVSQTLPVLVALLAAGPGQLVYLDQPEIHLHPVAQVEIAKSLANAAMRGVRVVLETHSSLVLLGIQTLVAEGKLSPDIVSLHWFCRSEDGSTQVRTASVDQTGSFGDWPEDLTRRPYGHNLTI